MAAEIFQTGGVRMSTAVQDPYVELPYLIRYTEDEVEAEALIYEVLRSTFILTDGREIYLTNWTKEHVGGGVWNVLVRFASNEPTGFNPASFGGASPGGGSGGGGGGGGPGGSSADGPLYSQSFSFDTAGGTANIKQSHFTVARYPDAAPDRQGAINANGQEVAGVDINVGGFQFTVTRYASASMLPLDFWNTLRDLTGKVNSSEITITLAGGHSMTFDEGELLLLSVSGGQKGTEAYEFTFRFAAQTNQYNLQIPGIDAPDGIDRQGWDYLWIAYRAEEQGTAPNKVITQVPSAVYIERVYDRRSFAPLGIT